MESPRSLTFIYNNILWLKRLIPQCESSYKPLAMCAKELANIGLNLLQYITDINDDAVSDTNHEKRNNIPVIQ